jgi:hypothetical protein
MTGIDRIRDGLAVAEATGTRVWTPFHLILLPRLWRLPEE